jgi:hypothetical protein
MRTQRKPMGGGAVAFIDVMACGLGAVVLLLVIVDFNIAEIIPQIVSPAVTDQVTAPKLSQEDLEDRIESARRDNLALADSVAGLTTKLLEEEITRDALEIPVVAPQSEPIPNVRANQSGQLIGLQVDGRSIVVLLDVSGSMYSEILADNVYYSVAPSKKQSDLSTKWAQAKRITEWLVEVAPANSDIKLATFAESAREVSKGWRKKVSLGPDISAQLASVIPQGGTDLQQALAWLSRNSRSGAQVFLITDGMPTKLASRGLVSRLFSACTRDPKGFVGGECRKQIFMRSVDSLANVNLELNVILLPLEGDPMAAPHYWGLARSKGGLVFVPEQSWP